MLKCERYVGGGYTDGKNPGVKKACIDRGIFDFTMLSKNFCSLGRILMKKNFEKSKRACFVAVIIAAEAQNPLYYEWRF